MKYEASNRKMEDLLSNFGVPSFCYVQDIDTDEDSEGFYDKKLQIVLPSDKYISKVNKVLRENNEKVLLLYGYGCQVSPQFLVYYVSYLYVGAYAKNETGFFISTVFEDIKSAEPKVIDGKQVLSLKLKITIIKESQSVKSYEDVRTEVVALLERFNSKSRFIKFSNARFGEARSRTDFDVSYIDTVLKGACED